jgi:chaperonin GroES
MNQSALKVRPVRDFLLVQPESLEEVSKGGILIPKTAKQKHMFAKVLAVGPGRVTERGRIEIADVKVGDRVVLSAHNMAQRVDRIGEDGPMLVPEMDVEAIIES